jgi:hypothetical protein
MLTMLILILSASCTISPHKYGKAPFYSYVNSQKSELVATKKINILLLPVTDSRSHPAELGATGYYTIESPPNYWGKMYSFQVDNRLLFLYYFTEPVSEIVRKIIQSELKSFGYNVLLYNDTKDVAVHKNNSFFFKVDLLEFLCVEHDKRFRTTYSFAVSLNTVLMDGTGKIVARNQFRHSPPGEARHPMTSYNFDEKGNLLINRCLPQVLKDIAIWIDNNLSKDKPKDSEDAGEANMVTKKLEKLKEMKEKGLITEEEYQNKRKEILKMF